MSKSNLFIDIFNICQFSSKKAEKKENLPRYLSMSLRNLVGDSL